MKTLKFKSNIKCMGCVARVTPVLNEAKGITKWEVDIYNPQKTLTVATESLNAQDVASLVEKAGFKAEEV
jgi:copper chaperone